MSNPNTTLSKYLWFKITKIFLKKLPINAYKRLVIALVIRTWCINSYDGYKFGDIIIPLNSFVPIGWLQCSNVNLILILNFHIIIFGPSIVKRANIIK